MDGKRSLLEPVIPVLVIIIPHSAHVMMSLSTSIQEKIALEPPVRTPVWYISLLPAAVCGELHPKKEQAVHVRGEGTALRTLNQVSRFCCIRAV